MFLLFINNFSQNSFWNLKPLNQPAHQIETPLHCECNISVTMAGIIKWFGYTIHRIHSYNWSKFEDLTPTGSYSRERQKVWHLSWHDLYTAPIPVRDITNIVFSGTDTEINWLDCLVNWCDTSQLWVGMSFSELAWNLQIPWVALRVSKQVTKLPEARPRTKAPNGDSNNSIQFLTRVIFSDLYSSFNWIKVE